MPDFTPTYAPADGAVLDPSGLNDNLYRVTAGRSIYEIGNGSIESANFAGGFQIRAHHVRPGQAGDAVSVGTVLPNDYFSDLYMGSGANYLPIVGTCVTFYTKYDASLALFAASGFASIWRQFGPSSAGAFGTRLTAPHIRVKAFLQSATGGGLNLLDHTQREMPQTVHFNSASANPVAQVATREQRLTRHFNLAHARVSGGSAPHQPLTAGWYTFGLAVLVLQNLAGQDTGNALEDMQLRLNGAGSADARPSTYFSAIHRIRLYTRNVTAIRLL